MKAYKSKNGSVLAVFKDWHNTYGIYCRKADTKEFKKLEGVIYPARATRDEAEKDMQDYVRRRSYDRTWEEVEFKG